MSSIDYAGIASTLLSMANSLLPEWLPGGKFQGKYYQCGSIGGGAGNSFKVSTDTGLWGEFNGSGQTGKDMVDLFGAIYHLSNHEAALRLDSQYLAGRYTSTDMPIAPKTALQTQKNETNIQKPPVNAKAPAFSVGGKAATASWRYCNPQGETLFYIARFDTPEGKNIMPYCWNGEKWVMKHWPAPRPLYGLELLETKPTAPIMIVEGEKAADAARSLLGHIYVVMSWPGGAQAVEKTDWSPLKGKKILLWPDADEPGLKAMAKIAEKLVRECPEIKVLNPLAEPDPKGDGWDAADALVAGWKDVDVITWAKARVKVIEITAEPVHIAKPKERSVVQVENVTNQSEPSRSLQGMWLEVGIAQTSKGVPIYNEENVLRIFERDEFFKDFIWWDTFHKKLFTHWSQIGKNGVLQEWSDVQLLRLSSYLQRDWGLSKINYLQVSRAAEIYAHNNERNEPCQWIESLKWDGVERIEHCFQDVFDTPDDAYSRNVSKNFFVSLIARLFDPGCQVDTMVIFEGKQGIYKSSALRVLGGKWYASCRSNIGSPNFYSNIQGKWIIEVAEMDSFKKAEISQIKEMLTTPVDRFKLPYAKYSADFPRQSVFVGTTNESEYLQDMTGARRFWPITCQRVNLSWLMTNREQLFAEAYQRWLKFANWRKENPKVNAAEAPENWWKMPDDLAKAEQEKRRQHDPWEDPIGEYIGKHRADGVNIREILKELAISNGQQDRREQMRVARILRYFGWEKKDTRLGDGRILKIWHPEQEEGVRVD